jgi:transcription initiation factor TFIID subunit 11
VDDEEEEEGGGANMAVQMAAGTLEEKKKEMEHRALLTSNLDPEQFARFEAWRSSRLSEAVVRRVCSDYSRWVSAFTDTSQIVNQTLSQSAPASVILAVKSVAKIFAGEMIEGARKVQTQWLESSGEDQTTGLPSPPAEGDNPKEKETRRGPLLPDHMREALRRHRLTRDGGLPGQLDLWKQQQSSGVERFGLKAVGKRLMK